MSKDHVVTADDTLSQLQAQLHSAWLSDLTAIVEQWLETPSGRCRVAVADSDYGLHFEIGPLDGPTSQPTQVFGRQHRDQAVALLASYLQPVG